MTDHDRDEPVDDAALNLALLARAERGVRADAEVVVGNAMASATTARALGRRRSRRPALLAAAAVLLLAAGTTLWSVGRGGRSVDVRPASPTTVRPAPTVGPAPTVTSPTSAPASTTPTVSPTTTAPPAGAWRAGRYLEESRPVADSVALVLHEAGGAVVREVYRASTYAAGDDLAVSPILDAELAPDGAIYVVERTDRSEAALRRPGGTRLVALGADGTATTVKENVVGSELSPDGTRIAIVVVSPDGDGDGMGRRVVRVLDRTTGDVTDVWSTTFHVDADGNITDEVGGVDVVGWSADQSSLIVEEGCCDSGQVMLVPSGGGGSPATWPGVSGDHATYALGWDRGGRLLVQRNAFGDVESTDGTSYEDVTGIEIVALSPTGDVSPPLVTVPSRSGELDRRHYDLIGSVVDGTPLAEQTDAGVWTRPDLRAPRRFR